MPTGVSRSSRGGQTWVWRHSALACLLSQRGMVASTPLGWGGGPSRVWALPGPRPGDPSLSPEDSSHSHSGILGGAGWAPEPQAWLEDGKAEGTSRGQGSAGLRPRGPGLLLSSSLFVPASWLFDFFFLCLWVTQGSRSLWCDGESQDGKPGD